MLTSMSARSYPETSNSCTVASSAFREWKTPVTSRVRTVSRISSDDSCIACSRQRLQSSRIVEFGQLLKFVLGRAGQRDLPFLVVDDKAVKRHRHKTSADTKEATYLQHCEIQLFLVLVRDHIIDSPDPLVLVVDNAAANYLA